MKLLDILLRPKKGIDEIREDGLGQAAFFLVTLILFVFLFLTYTYLQQINAYLQQIGLGITITPKVYILAYVGFSVFFIILAFFRCWIIHLFVRLFKGKHGYAETYKALVYGRAPEYISAPLLFLIFILVLRGMYLWVIIPGLLVAGLSVYQMVLRSSALASLQGLSKGKAFLSIYVLGFIVQLLVLVVIEVILILLFLVVRSIG
ncbi:MAG: YIP1 family protein [Candidatus Woesearchaeota archaeon]